MLKKIAKKTLNVLVIALFALSVLLLAAAVFGRISGSGEIFGFQVYNVISGSMEPQIRVNDVVVVRRTDFSQIAEDDVIVFDLPNISHPVTHRVIELTDTGFITHGDANAQNVTENVPFESVRGKVVLKVPYLGHLKSFLDSTAGFLVLIFIPLATIIALETVSLVKKYREYRDEEVQKDIDRLEEEKRRLEGNQHLAGADSGGKDIEGSAAEAPAADDTEYGSQN